MLRRLARRLPGLRPLHTYIRALETERDALRADLGHWRTWMSPGHFYSPIPNAAEVRAREAELFGDPPPALPGIELHVERQLALVHELARFYGELPFSRERSDATRYWYVNPAFSFGDAIVLYSMLRHLQPRRVIEIGSGYSSALMLDTRERFLPDVELTFIDPDSSTLRSLMREGDRADVIASPVQSVPLERFDGLEASDVLFVDSTHVAKTGSDVNRIVFDILPRLKSGVYVHFHDVFYPFEYPKEWVYEGRAWNEDYLLRAFLQFNDAFEIVLFSTYVARFHRELLQREMPLVLENPGGALWLRRR
ncbi:MAG TPA: class I SAM-dependent methyltransferase [Thermoanaerobaculia bacterium]|nr:class I SAM-dependent methyltransferase [Thermoanaerobaculia bacterium]